MAVHFLQTSEFEKSARKIEQHLYDSVVETKKDAESSLRFQSEPIMTSTLRCLISNHNSMTKLSSSHRESLRFTLYPKHPSLSPRFSASVFPAESDIYNRAVYYSYGSPPFREKGGSSLYSAQFGRALRAGSMPLILKSALRDLSCWRVGLAGFEIGDHIPNQARSDISRKH
jgi:hypothetical protein